MFRPPFGVINPHVRDAVRQSGHRVIGWNVRSYDTMINDKHKLMHRLMRLLRPGAVVLLHDHGKRTLEVLPEFIRAVLEQGYTIEPLDKLINRNLMFREIFTLFLLLLTHSLAAQQPTGFSPVKDEKAFRENFTQAGKQIQTIQSDFTQEKNLSMLEEKIISKGQFFFKKEKKVRLEYTTPYKYLMIINGDNIMVQDDKKTNKFSAKSNKMFRRGIQRNHRGLPVRRRAGQPELQRADV